MKDNKLKIQIAAGVLLIIVGTSVLLNDYIKEKREEVFSSMNLALSSIIEEDSNVGEESTANVVQEEEERELEEVSNETTTNVSDNYESYLGILEISKIDFYKGFYDKESSLNNVKFNLEFLEVSDYPDEDKGNVIIIGHSGNYSNSYFANLYKLEVGDTASIYYKDKKYNYEIVNIYNEYKDGTVNIYRDIRESCLTLITCTKDDDYHQTVYIFELVNVE